jgi:GMP synthase-like glutamine amidotransferase
MQAHYFQHVPFEGLGSIEPWMEKNGYRLSHTKWYETTITPKPADIDLLIVMGGPMSVNDERKHPWLAVEKRFIHDAIEAGTSVLGICLGAQLIASALGARVYRNHEKEIGWFPVHGLPAEDGSSFRFPPSMLAFHWHGETFDLPAGATLIARSDGCKHQAFQIGSAVIGLQFHLETTPASAAALVSNCRDELIPAPFVQSENDIVSVTADVYARINAEMNKVLSYLDTGRANR